MVVESISTKTNVVIDETMLKSLGVNVSYPDPEEVAISSMDISRQLLTIESRLLPQYKEYKYVLEALSQYVLSPIITDSFTSDLERNKWESETLKSSELREFFTSNKLKGNKIGNVLNCAGLAKDSGWISASLVSRYLDLLKSYRGEGKPGEQYVYDKMSNEEKVAFVKKLSLFARDLYKSLSIFFMTGQVR